MRILEFLGIKMFACPKCGEELNIGDDYSFCSNCDNIIDTIELLIMKEQD